MSINKQESQEVQMQRQVKYCKDITNATGTIPLQLKLDQIKILYEEILKNQDEIDETCDKEEFKKQIAKRATFEDQYFYCVVTFQERINQIKEAAALALRAKDAGANNNRVPVQQEVKLPRIELKSFSGRYEDWSSFRDLYSSLIHTNDLLSNVQKLQYLKSNIQGDAENLLKSITITEDNYADAWKKLTDRYEHKRYIVDCLLNNFFNQARVQGENHKDIKSLIDKSSEIIQSLKLQGVPVAHWDVIIGIIIIIMSSFQN